MGLIVLTLEPPAKLLLQAVEQTVEVMMRYVRNGSWL